MCLYFVVVKGSTRVTVNLTVSQRKSGSSEDLAVVDISQ